MIPISYQSGGGHIYCCEKNNVYHWGKRCCRCNKNRFGITYIHNKAKARLCINCVETLWGVL